MRPADKQRLTNREVIVIGSSDDEEAEVVQKTQQNTQETFGGTDDTNLEGYVSRGEKLWIESSQRNREQEQTKNGKKEDTMEEGRVGEKGIHQIRNESSELAWKQTKVEKGTTRFKREEHEFITERTAKKYTNGQEGKREKTEEDSAHIKPEEPVFYRFKSEEPVFSGGGHTDANKYMTRQSWKRTKIEGGSCGLKQEKTEFKRYLSREEAARESDKDFWIRIQTPETPKEKRFKDRVNQINASTGMEYLELIARKNTPEDREFWDDVMSVGGLPSDYNKHSMTKLEESMSCWSQASKVKSERKSNKREDSKIKVEPESETKIKQETEPKLE
jgi:hypothetical protein